MHTDDTLGAACGSLFQPWAGHDPGCVVGCPVTLETTTTTTKEKQQRKIREPRMSEAALGLHIICITPLWG